ncbi:hypothetical protein AVEN_47484-1 [Araneus ventricosus]|uniref:Uncharacterized protein n=1 Tax=Araneus ventricosus TaxID=182803 RepID=A0A4Y2JJ22_ARAVE|nr:hypothetical protein AVEN_47484-1 [Araneus ventricosus]
MIMDLTPHSTEAQCKAGYSRALLSSQIVLLHFKPGRQSETPMRIEAVWSKIRFPTSLDIQQLHLACRAISAEKRPVQIHQGEGLKISRSIEIRNRWRVVF